MRAAYTFNDQGLHDFSTNKFHLTGSGTITYPATTSPAGFGYDASFASGAYGSNTSFDAFTAYTGMSISLYLNYSSGNGKIINNSACSVTLNSGGTITWTLLKSDNVTPISITSSASLSASTWYHVVLVWDGTFMYIYVNGALDNTSDGPHTNMGTGDSTWYVGSVTGTTTLLMNVTELYNRNLSIQEVTSLYTSPGGCLYTCQENNFAIGDFLMEGSVTSQAVVTWVNDTTSYYAYPLTGGGKGHYTKYGNIYQTARQYIMEISNDFDGNGNSQISIKWPIASLTDYNSPANSRTFDYNGLSGYISGSGTANAIPVFTGTNSIGNSAFLQSGNNLFIPTGKYVAGAARINLHYGAGLKQGASISTDNDVFHTPFFLADRDGGFAEMAVGSSTGAEALQLIGGGGAELDITSGQYFVIYFGSNAVQLDGSLVSTTYIAQLPNKTGTQIFAMQSDVVGVYLPLAGGTMTGTLTLAGNPSGALDAATKQYVDAAIQGLNQKPTADLATTTTLPANTYSNGTSGVGATLTGNSNGALAAIDGVSPTANMLILVKNEANQRFNGLYTVTQVGDASHPYILTRHVDMDQSSEFNGALIPVDNEGSSNANTLWIMYYVSGFVVGTNSVAFTQIGGTPYTNGTGISISGTVISLASGVCTPGTYSSVTVDTYGRVTAGTNPGYLTSAYYQTIQKDASSMTQRNNINLTKDFNVTDNAGNNSTDIKIKGKYKLYLYNNM